MTVTAEPGPAVATAPPAIGGPVRPGRFAAGLGAIVAFGLVFRIGYVLIVTSNENGKLYDAFWYSVTSGEMLHGQFFRTPFANTPTAGHPPLTSLLIGGMGFLIGPSETMRGQEICMAILGAAVVLCVGLLGRAVAGPWVGLVAAGLAAIAPNFWIPSGILMSETPTMLVMALLLLALVHLMRSPSYLNAALVGAACGAEALTRAELILCVPALLVPAALLARQVPLRRRVGLLGVGLLVTLTVLAPWVGRNLATFKDPTYLSTGDGLALLGANCPLTYSGPSLGSWNLGCAVAITNREESVESAMDQHAALQFAEHHADRLPIVVLARIGRLWDFYEPIQMASVDVNEGRPRPASLMGLGLYYALLPLGVAGIVVLRRRRIPQWFLLVPAGIVTVSSALFYGQVRFRAPFEVCLVVLAAPPLVLMAQRVAGRRPEVGPTGTDGTGAGPAGAGTAPPEMTPVVV